MPQIPHKLYRLISNPETVVAVDGEFHNVIWANSMYCGYDARWMIARAKKSNMTQITIEDRQLVLEDLARFMFGYDQVKKLEFLEINK